MKAAQILALVGISMLAMSNSCEKSDNVSPTAALTTGRLVKQENTIEATGKITRVRWIIDLAPVTLPGYQGIMYSQAKVFNLPATPSYSVGQTISFRYQLVPYDQQTPWKTGYEWNGVPAMPAGAISLPEITISDTSN